MSRGFTLVEMAMVVIIVFLLMGSLLIPLPERINTQKVKQTEQILEEIKEALIGFAILNGRLPCPADIPPDDGKEADLDESNKICQTYNNFDGYLPWATLGVGRYDAWGRPFRYRVDGKFSDLPLPADPTAIPPKPAEPAIDDPPITAHDLLVEDSAKNPLSTSTVNGSDVIAIVFSCGKNGRPDRENDTDENWNDNRNCDNPITNKKNNRIYVQDVPVYIGDGVDKASTSPYFDDILIWLPKNILINRLVAAGKWPPKSPSSTP